ncbi:DUF4091 domain-containing protein [Labilibacter sediminis]|nr:DUF4091 domain-containing protein [Labilibacter sediminis]
MCVKMNQKCKSNKRIDMDIIQKLFGKLLLIFIVLICFFSNLKAQKSNGSFESKFKRYQKGEKFEGVKTNEWRAVVWKGEKIHQQIVLWSDSSHENVTYKIKDLINAENKKSKIDRSNISLRFPSYVKGDVAPRSCTTIAEGENFNEERPYAEVADALIRKAVNHLSPSDPLKLWLTIDVPRSLESGLYKGEIKVTLDKENIQTFKVEIQVLDRVIPEVKDWSFHLDIWQWPLQVLKYYNVSERHKPIKPWSKEHFKLLAPFYEILGGMGQKVIFTQVNEAHNPMIKWFLDEDGCWSFDFTDFDKYVDHMEEWGIEKQISCHSLLGSKRNELPYFKVNDNSLYYLKIEKWTPEYEKIWSTFLIHFKQHLVEKGWFHKTVLYMDELRCEEMNDVVSFVRKNDQDWKLAMAYGSVQSQNTMNQLYDASGILGVVNTTGREKKTNTFYTSCTETIPNNYTTPVNSVAEMTWMAWHAHREGLDGYLRWAFDYWTKEDPFDTRDGAFTSGDFSMIYRSKNGQGMKPVMGIRTEMLREGIQDFEKIKILKEEFEVNRDTLKLKLLNGMIDKFSASSGSNANQLVVEGQELLKNLSKGIVVVDSTKTVSNQVHIEVNEISNQITISAQKEFTEVEVLTYKGKRILFQKFQEPVMGGNIFLANLLPDYYLVRVKLVEGTYVEVIRLE